MKQSELFQPALPDGFEYVPSFINVAEETLLLAAIAELPLKEARYKSYTAKRRMVSFGSSYDFDENQLLPAPPLPTFLFSLRDKVADWLAIVPSELAHAMVAEYRPGTALGWHRDAPNFQAVAGISLAGSC